MNVLCPKCALTLTIPPEMQRQIDQGTGLKLKCPKCGAPIKLGKSTKDPAQVSERSEPLPHKDIGAASSGQKIQPPQPPQLDWLNSPEQSEAVAQKGDIPMALVLWPNNATRNSVLQTLQALGYQVVCVENGGDAEEQMRFMRFTCLAYFIDMDGGPDTSSFHDSMRAMTMDRRRGIFYLLVGDNLHTLYDLEALVYSANLTVNTKDLPKLPLILSKAFRAHEELFGALLEELGTGRGL